MRRLVIGMLIGAFFIGNAVTGIERRVVVGDPVRGGQVMAALDQVAYDHNAELAALRSRILIARVATPWEGKDRIFLSIDIGTSNYFPVIQEDADSVPGGSEYLTAEVGPLYDSGLTDSGFYVLSTDTTFCDSVTCFIFKE